VVLWASFLPKIIIFWKKAINYQLIYEEGSDISDSMRLREIDRKIVLLGDGKVGKTSIISKYVDKTFNPGYIPGTGLKVFSKSLEFTYPNLIINLRMAIWDTAGQKWYQRIREQALDGTDGIILVSDLSRPETIASLQEFWLDEVKKSTNRPPISIIGNKLDLITKNSPLIDLIESIGAKNGVDVFLTSAKMGDNIDNVFRLAGERFVIELISEIESERREKPTTLKEAVDYIIEDFLTQHGDMQKGLLIVQNQFRESGLNFDKPEKKIILIALEKLREVEESLLSKTIATGNYDDRRRMVESIKKSD